MEVARLSISEDVLLGGATTETEITYSSRQPSPKNEFKQISREDVEVEVFKLELLIDAKPISNEEMQNIIKDLKLLE